MICACVFLGVIEEKDKIVGAVVNKETWIAMKYQHGEF